MSIDQTTALPIWGVQGRGGSSCAGVRTLFRHAAPRAFEADASPARVTPATELHGFLAYLIKCTVTGNPVHQFSGTKGNRSATISTPTIWSRRFGIFSTPRPGDVYNIGGSRLANCSMLEAITMTERLTGRPLRWTYHDANRSGDHIWWISDIGKLQAHYPDWSLTYNIDRIIAEIHEEQAARLVRHGG